MSKSRRERFDAVKYGSLLSALTLGCLIFALPVSPYNELPLTGQAKESPGLMRRGFTHLSNFEMDSAIRCWAPLAVHYAKDLSDQEKR